MKKGRNITLFANLLFFMILLVFWRFFYENHLLQMEQNQLFIITAGYLKDHLLSHGGLAVYLSEFISQFFLCKWGAAILISLCCLLFAIGIKKVFAKILGTQLFAFAFFPATVYAILLFNSLYQLSGLIAVIIATFSVIIYLNLKKGLLRIVAGFIMLILNYWFAGGAYILFVSTIIVSEIIITIKGNEKIKVLPQTGVVISGYIAVGVLMPLFFRHFIIVDNLLESYFSRDFYKINNILPIPIIVVFISTPILILFESILQNAIRVKFLKVIKPSCFVLIMISLVFYMFIFPDFQEEEEMHYDNLVVKQEWNEIISLAEKKTPTGQWGKTALTLAFAKTGQMSTKLFEFNPKLSDFFIPFNLKGKAPLIANEPYFNLGLINFSKMLCNETMESTSDAKLLVRAMKRFTEDCIICGQYKVAERYLWYLERTIFYRKWAKEAQQYLYNDTKVNVHPVWGKLRKQQPKDDFYLQYDKMDIAFVTLLRSNPQNKVAYEYLMSWYLLQKDFDKFLKYLPLVKKMDYKGIPKIYQQALAYVATLMDKKPQALMQYAVSQEVQQKLNSYAKEFRRSEGKNSDAIKKEFGKTYWYYVHFAKIEKETNLGMASH